METEEQNSPDWNEGRRRFEEEPCTFRSLGSLLGVSHSAVAKRAKKDGWVKYQEGDEFCKPARKPLVDDGLTAGGGGVDDGRSVGPQEQYAGASTVDLTRRGRNLILDLMAELEFLNRNHQTLAEIVETYVCGEKEDGIRAKLLRSLDHETRAKTANNLATALAKLNDAAPGKKQERQENAENASSAGKFAAPSAPKLVVSNK